MSTITTHINIVWEASTDEWHARLTEDEPGTRDLEFGPFDGPSEARAWIAEAVAVPLPSPQNWGRVDKPDWENDGCSRITYHCTIDNEVPA